MVNSHQPIYHMCRLTEWQAAEAEGFYPGSSQDAADGFIHFSTAAQVAASAAKHRAGQAGLVLLAVDPVPLGEALRWEPARGGDGRSPDRDKQSRDGDLFPHLYGPLPVTVVIRADDLPLGPDGRHVFPPGVAAGEDGE